MLSAFPRPQDVVGVATPRSSNDTGGAVFLSQIPHGEVSDITSDGIPVKISDQLFLSSGYEPRIAYTRTISSLRSGAKIREACVEFWFEGQTLGGAKRKVNNVEVVEGVTGDRVKKSLRIEYENALVAGADNLDMTWPGLFVTWIDEFSQIRDNHLVVITLPYENSGYINTLEQKIAEYRKLQPGHTLRPFYDPSLEEVKHTEQETSEAVDTAIQQELTPITDWVSMEDLHDGVRLEFAKTAARNAFPSLQAAEIMLTNGRYLDHKWEETLLNRLCGRITACIVLLDEKTMLAFVRYTKPLPADLKNVLSDRTQIKVELLPEPGDNQEKDYSGTGMIVANRMGVEAEFVVLLKELSPDLYRVAVPWDRSKLRWRHAEIALLQNQALAKKEIEAVRLLCRPKSYNARFQPMLLGEDLAASSREHWLRDVVGCSQDRIEACIDAVMEKMEGLGRKMNPEQESILRNVQHSYHSVDMIRGPPGCGKTTLIAAVADFLIRCSDDIVVFMCAPSNGNTHRIHEAVSHMLLAEPTIVAPGICTENAPIRVHRQHREEQYLLHEYDRLGQQEEASKGARRAASFAKEFDQVADDAKWYDRVAKADDKREMSDPLTGVTAAVVDLVERNPNLKVWTDSTRPEDAAAIFRDGLERLKQTSFQNWYWKDRKTFLFAWRFLARRVIANKRIICSTVGNISSSLMSEVMRKLKAGVKRQGVIIIDEASLTTDPALCNALVNVVSHERIQSEFEGRSPILKLILIGDEAQGYPVIKTESEGYNYFGGQLARVTYERLVQVGANVQMMWEQFRMVPALCEMPNQRWYGGKLRCSQERKQARLTPDQKLLLVEYFDVDLNKLPANPEDRAQAEDQYLRLLLANVPSGVCQVEPQTQSRLNMANVEVIIRIFKELFYKGIKGGRSIAASLKEIVVLTFYNAQRRRLLNALFDMGKALGLPEGALDDCLHTVDSYQGREAKYVILDTTVCSYRGKDSLGHAGDERKACVASTRAKDLMIVVGNLNILRADFKHADQMPFVIELLKALKQRGAYKTFRTRARPERLVGAVRDADLPTKVKEPKEETAATGTIANDQVVAVASADLAVKVDESEKETVSTGAPPKTEIGADGDAGRSVKVEELKREAALEDLTPGSSTASVILTPTSSNAGDSDAEEVQDWTELIKSVRAIGLQGSHSG